MSDQAPKKIYLQTGDPEQAPPNYLDSAGSDVTWCVDRINDHDIKYIRADLVDKMHDELLSDIVKLKTDLANALDDVEDMYSDFRERD